MALSTGKVDTGLEGGVRPFCLLNRIATVASQVELASHLFPVVPSSPGSRGLSLCTLGSGMCP